VAPALGSVKLVKLPTAVPSSLLLTLHSSNVFAVVNLTNLTEPKAGATNIVAALEDHEARTEALDAIVGVEALWDAGGTYDTLREAVNKNHSDIGVIAGTAGIDLAGSALSGYNGSETTLVAILNAQRAVDIASDADIASNDTDIATINTKLGTITAAAMGTTAATGGPAILELHGEVTTATSNIAGLGTTFVAVAGDTMTGTLITASSGLSVPVIKHQPQLQMLFLSQQY
jgi:hypothetical protein